MFKQKIAYIIEKRLNAKKMANNKKMYDQVMKSVDKMITELSSHDEFNLSCKPLILEYIINTLLDSICAESIFKPLCNLNSFPAPFFCNFYNEKGNTLSFSDNSKKVNVNLSSTKIYLHPWNNVRARESLVNISENDFVYDKNNHFAIYYPYINLCYVTCGNHSINAGRYFRKGSIVADEYDLTACFSHIETDGSYWFNTHTNEPLIPVKDYRFAAIFTIAKMKYKLNDCIYRSDCHNCTDVLPHLAADCPRALPGKKRARLTSHQTGSCETNLMSLISFPDNQFHSHQVSL